MTTVEASIPVPKNIKKYNENSDTAILFLDICSNELKAWAQKNNYIPS